MRSMENRFIYLIEKIKKHPLQEEPFKHLEIEDFLDEQDFEEITSATDIKIKAQKNDLELFDELFNAGYKMVPFPGTITNHLQYVLSRQVKEPLPNKTTCESAGIVLRLTEPKSTVLTELKQFIESKPFNQALAEKFMLELDYCSVDTGVQKYLDGYEISPHPDLRKKALTYMVNINPSSKAEHSSHHTHYMSFKKERLYVRELWKNNTDVERCWIPWEWASSHKQQVKNNSITIFAPSFDTLHAVKAHYCHLEYQRTQIYGNLWHKEDSPHYSTPSRKLEWWDLDFNKKPKEDPRNQIWNQIDIRSDESLIDRNRKSNY
jgi:hypothetical protein